MTDKECYRKLYGDLIYAVSHYYPKKRFSQSEINYYLSLGNSVSI